MAENLTQVKVTSWGRFANPWSTWEDTRLRAGFILGFTAGDADSSPSPSDPRLACHLPIYRPKFEAQGDGVRLTWLGHSSVLVYVDGVRVLCDPVFSERCSASQYFGPRRYRPLPCKVGSSNRKAMPQSQWLIVPCLKAGF